MEENRKLTDEMLENVTGAGVMPVEPKYNIGDRVGFIYHGTDYLKGTISDIFYFASTKTWRYYIHTGTVVPYDVSEADIEGLI